MHRLSDLCYRLIEGPGRLEPLCVLATRAAIWQGWTVTFTVLGASHAVCFERAESRLTELLTCAPPAGAGKALMEIATDRPREFRITAGQWQFHIRLTPFALTEGDTLPAYYDAAQQLNISYPAQPHHAVPVTRIGWRCEEGQLCIETVHTYPEEGRGVRSRTLFSRREERDE